MRGWGRCEWGVAFETLGKWLSVAEVGVEEMVEPVGNGGMGKKGSCLTRI